MVEEVKKLEADQAMCEAQLAALDSKPAFKTHPRARDYRRDLSEELEGLLKQKEKLVAKRDSFYELYEWSKLIVKVCEWLELNMEEYCKKHMTDLPPSFFKNSTPVPELTETEIKDYSKGLAEITYNLQESQDFFQASVDGRLLKYHNIEKELIEEQLRVIRTFPDGARRQYIEAELLKDLEYVGGHMQDNPEGKKRKEKMLKNHAEFFKVLKYYREKLGVLGGDNTERKYDPKFDHYQ